MKRNALSCCLAMLIAATMYSQTGKYFNATGEKCKTAKVFIDHRIQQYCGTNFTVNWTGGCSESYAQGQGKLTIIIKTALASFTMLYEGQLIKGKKEGKGDLSFYLFYSIMAPAYSYSGSFKNDEFDGYGEFKADYPYPVEPGDIGKGISMESYRFDMDIWRSDLYFYEYNGNFINGKIADTENGSGKTKNMRRIGKRAEYSGPVKNGKPNGKGFAGELEVTNLPPIRPNGQERNSYKGDFVNGRLHGSGKEVGAYFDYEGNFVNDIREGKGRMTMYEYTGVWQVMQDRTLTEGRNASYILDGNFSNGQAEGFFTIYFQNSAAYKYTGPMKRGVIEGTGEIEYIDGSKFRGNFRSNKREGEGTVVFEDGDKFTGEFKNDLPVTGTFYYGNGSKYEGEVGARQERKNNKPVTTYIRQGRGTITYSDGTKKEVTCQNDVCN